MSMVRFEPAILWVTVFHAAFSATEPVTNIEQVLSILPRSLSVFQLRAHIFHRTIQRGKSGVVLRVSAMFILFYCLFLKLLNRIRAISDQFRLLYLYIQGSVHAVCIVPTRTYLRVGFTQRPCYSLLSSLSLSNVRNFEVFLTGE